MTDDEREQFLCTLKRNRGHPLHQEGEDPFYSEEINKRLEAERKQNYIVSVDRWVQERDDVGAEWAEERQKREVREKQERKPIDRQSPRPASAPNTLL